VEENKVMRLLGASSPFFSLPSSYSFDGSGSGLVALPSLVCVKGASPRSIYFEMKTIQQVVDWRVMIGAV